MALSVASITPVRSIATRLGQAKSTISSASSVMALHPTKVKRSSRMHIYNREKRLLVSSFPTATKLSLRMNLA